MAFLLGIVVGALSVYMGAELVVHHLRRRRLEQRRLQAERLAEVLSFSVRRPENVARRAELMNGYGNRGDSAA